jgi:hypothetical protein
VIHPAPGCLSNNGLLQPSSGTLFNGIRVRLGGRIPRCSRERSRWLEHTTVGTTPDGHGRCEKLRTQIPALAVGDADNSHGPTIPGRPGTSSTGTPTPPWRPNTGAATHAPGKRVNDLERQRVAPGEVASPRVNPDHHGRVSGWRAAGDPAASQIPPRSHRGVSDNK